MTATSLHIHKLAEMSGLAESEAFHRMLESAMTGLFTFETQNLKFRLSCIFVQTSDPHLSLH